MRNLVLLLLLASGLGATVPQAPRTPWEPGPSRDNLSPGRGGAAREYPAQLGPFCWLREYAQICAFLDVWQVHQPASANHGGMIEAEAGPLGDVIQTDNTLEAIWVWSRWRRWTGETTWAANVDAAWVYCRRYPAWQEEGALGDNYYRAHNCAWGLAAALEHEAASGDTSARAYGRDCARYIAEHPLPLGSNNSLNALVTGWCVGSLHDYGLAVGEPHWCEVAVEQGLDLLDFVEQEPADWLAWDEWAMSGGTLLWGLCRSVFADAPLLAQHWLPDHVFEVPDWSDWHNVSGYDWDSSWNVAYANGLRAVQQAVGDPVSAWRARHIAEGLLSHDVDDDGGIMADSHDPSDEDMSWVTCYLARFCLAPLVGTPPAADVAPLRLHGLVDEAVVPAGLPLELWPILANEGLQAASQVPVTLQIDGQIVAVGWGSVERADLDTLSFGSWVPAAGRHTVRLWTSWPQDVVAANDTLRLDLVALAPPASPATRDHEITWKAVAQGGRLTLDGVPADKPLQVEVFNLLGQRLAHFELPGGSSSPHSVDWLRHCPGLADGLYLLRVELEGEARVLRAHTFL